MTRRLEQKQWTPQDTVEIFDRIGQVLVCIAEMHERVQKQDKNRLLELATSANGHIEDIQYRMIDMGAVVKP